MTTASITLSGEVNALGFGTVQVGPASLELTAAIGSREVRTLASGDTTISLPTGTSAVFIRPPSGNTIALSWMGAEGETAFRLHDTNWSLISVHSATTEIVLSAGSTLAGVELVYL